MVWKEWGEVVLRSITSLIFLFFLTRMLGKKQVSQLSIFDYVIGISMGSIAAEMTLNIKSAYSSGFTSMAIYAVIAYAVSYFSMKSITFRRFVVGTPVVLIEKGVIIKSNLKKVLIDINDLLEETRMNGYFDLSEIDYAIMETSGKISFLPKVENMPVKNQDLKLKVQAKGVLANLIIDGKIMADNLKKVKRTPKWLKTEIKKQGYNNLEEIILATLDDTQKLIVYKYADKPKTDTTLE